MKEFPSGFVVARRLPPVVDASRRRNDPRKAALVAEHGAI